MSILKKCNVKNPRTLAQLKCKMIFRWNKVFEAWNGYLTKHDGTSNHIKAFVYNTKTEAKNAATIWANRNTRKLRNYRGV